MTRTLFNISSGDRVAIDGRVYTLDAMIPNGTGKPEEVDEFQFKEDRIARATRYSTKKFLRLYNAGKVRLLSPTERMEDGAPSQESFRPHDIEGDKRAKDAVGKAYRRLAYTKAYDAAPGALSNASLASFIAVVAQQIGDNSPPSPGSLRRWIRQRGVPGVRRLNEMMGRHSKGACGSRLQARVQEILADEAECFWDSIRVSAYDVWVKVTHRVNSENAQRPHYEVPLARPAPATVWRWLNAHLNFDRAKRRWGAQEAVRRFGVIKGSMTADALLDIAILDHTILDCWIIDDQTHQPIGRPSLTLLMDSCSRMILGFHLGWQSAGLDAALAALRHAVRTKDYVREQYPDIAYGWPAYGQPRTLVVDQGLEFMGTTFEDVCLSLGISLEPAPPRTPEYKGEIERLNSTISKGLIHKVPGSVPLKPQQLREFGIDPEKTAVLFLSDAIELIHHWIITVYSREVHSTLGVPPVKAWMDRSATDIIELCPNLEELDRACARTKIVALTREGIKLFGNLVYRCPELATIREAAAQVSPAKAKSRQGSVKVKVTYNAEDISKVYVWNPKTGKSLEVPCVFPTYTRGLSEHLHLRLREFQNADNESFQSEAQMCANRVALARRMEEICETRVLDRKRLQRLRHPERQAQHDLVKFEQLEPSGEVSKVMEVAVDTLGKRDFTAPREKRPLLKSKSRKRKDPARSAPPKAKHATQTAAPPATAIPRLSSFDWAKAVDWARKARSGGQA